MNAVAMGHQARIVLRIPPITRDIREDIESGFRRICWVIAEKIFQYGTLSPNTRASIARGNSQGQGKHEGITALGAGNQVENARPLLPRRELLMPEKRQRGQCTARDVATSVSAARELGSSAAAPRANIRCKNAKTPLTTKRPGQLDAPISTPLTPSQLDSQATMTSSEEQSRYHPRDAISAAARTTLITGSVGLFTSAIQNTLAKQNVGPWGVFTRTGGTVTLFATMGGAYEFVRTASANLREKDDHWNAAWGGFAAGAAMGFRDLMVLARTFPAVIGYGATVATVLGIFEYTGGSLRGYKENPDVDEFDKREALRTNYRSPGEQTIAELGEGRGIHAPGYAERRRDRIKQNYGIDVPVTQPSAS
ncbi:conserved hypothetical protein [Uncinocarpus reesii 1704]|uniref:NADH-ubiquinone oxidoreductase 213 kDa subunit n=1 Tax=Uncinocarpus reesii (strain UAMH 1704) TaxID=336963 RepID=C4JSP3_UNCRE|nr:uncharacterized protein UREG_05482 [Uncinocarpus reesii 1704]EEP80640.1 conserved hypothetical protein [Uncinocarpus reesii 1704]